MKSHVPGSSGAPPPGEPLRAKPRLDETSTDILKQSIDRKARAGESAGGGSRRRPPREK